MSLVDTARGVGWGLAVRPLLRARDLAVAARHRAVRRACLALWRLDRALPPHRPSPAGVAAAAAAGLPREALTWGETPLATAVDVLRAAGVDARSTVVDLGAGRGTVLLAARLLGAQARGVELDPLRADPARAVVAAAGAALEIGDARAFPLDGATHVWVAWTCMPDEVRAALGERLAALPPGTRVIALTWDPPAGAFDVERRAPAAFSWGRATVIRARRR